MMTIPAVDRIPLRAERMVPEVLMVLGERMARADQEVEQPGARAPKGAKAVKVAPLPPTCVMPMMGGLTFRMDFARCWPPRIWGELAILR